MGGMGDDALDRDLAPGEREGTALASGLRRLLAVQPEERAARRLVGALADAIPAASCVALVLACDGDGDRVQISAGVGLDEATPKLLPGGLAAEAVAQAAIRFAPDPGAPFPAGTSLGAAAPVVAGPTRGAILLGVREGTIDEAALLLMRVAADRAALLLERERLAEEREEALRGVRRMEEELERRRRAVDIILGIVGHDLRNPLGAVHMSAALLQKKGGLAGWQARTVERMRSSAGRMNRIIADLLSYTRTRLGTGIPIARRESDLAEIVRRVVDELSAGNPDREILVEAAGDLAGEWDPDRLEQVASNLVSNAVDHGEPGTPVRVALRGEPDAVVLVVRNSGPGMPPEVLAHLFEPFSRAPDEKNRKASGLGLGLYISREIVRGHGGEIFASSEAETAVTVRLPRRAAP